MHLNRVCVCLTARTDYTLITTTGCNHIGRCDICISGRVVRYDNDLPKLSAAALPPRTHTYTLLSTLESCTSKSLIAYHGIQHSMNKKVRSHECECIHASPCCQCLCARNEPSSCYPRHESISNTSTHSKEGSHVDDGGAMTSS